jgi:putative ABC transport system permease protein
MEKEAIKRSFIVKGILEYIGAPGFANIDRSALISLQAANILFKKGNHYDMLLVVTVSPDLNEQVKRDIVNFYSNNVAVISPQAIVEVIQRAMAGFTTFTVSIAMVSLMVAAVGIVTTLFTSVMERTREIGLLKALGFRGHQILLMFLSEALIVGLIGGSLGIVVGFFGAHILMMRSITLGVRSVMIQPIFHIGDLFFVWVFTLIISIIAGFYPAWRGARLNPVEALRKE